MRRESLVWRQRRACASITCRWPRSGPTCWPTTSWLSTPAGMRMAAGIDFSLDVTGFSIAEVDQLIEGLAPEEPGDPGDHRLPDPAQVPSRCQSGDIWRLGPHRTICGDALDPAVVATLLDGEKAEMVFTDPPYNVAIDGNVSGLGKVRHREFAMASGEMTREEFVAFLSTAFANLMTHSCDGSIHLVCMDWRHMGEMLEA